MSDSSEAIASVVGKVKKWLARYFLFFVFLFLMLIKKKKKKKKIRKRFHAAIWSVISINRLGKLVEKVRLLRKFRKAARFHVKMVSFFLSSFFSLFLSKIKLELT